MAACKICGNDSGNRSHIAREMMFGYRDRFEYIECAVCGCPQIKKVPGDLSKYYPENYYFLEKRIEKRQGFLKRFRRRQKTKYWIFGHNVIGMVLAHKENKAPPFFIDWFKKIGIGVDSKILDVGCGSGSLLLDMGLYGFSDVTGIDPYIKDDII